MSLPPETEDFILALAGFTISEKSLGLNSRGATGLARVGADMLDFRGIGSVTRGTIFQLLNESYQDWAERDEHVDKWRTADRGRSWRADIFCRPVHPDTITPDSPWLSTACQAVFSPRERVYRSKQLDKARRCWHFTLLRSEKRSSVGKQVRSKMMNEIERIQQWYRSQCDGEWEHVFGVTIGTRDNPGWTLTVDLKGTRLESTPFEPVAYRVDPDSEPEDEDWYVCRIEESQFKGFGGPHHLRTLLKAFLAWAKQE